MISAKILFLVQQGNMNVITYAETRGRAKSNCALIMGGNSDLYIVVTPLTNPGDRVCIDKLFLNV